MLIGAFACTRAIAPDAEFHVFGGEHSPALRHGPIADPSTLGC